MVTKRGYWDHRPLRFAINHIKLLSFLGKCSLIMQYPNNWYQHFLDKIEAILTRIGFEFYKVYKIKGELNSSVNPWKIADFWDVRFEDLWKTTHQKIFCIRRYKNVLSVPRTSFLLELSYMKIIDMLNIH